MRSNDERARGIDAADARPLAREQAVEPALPASNVQDVARPAKPRQFEHRLVEDEAPREIATIGPGRDPGRCGVLPAVRHGHASWPNVFACPADDVVHRPARTGLRSRKAVATRIDMARHVLPMRVGIGCIGVMLPHPRRVAPAASGRRDDEPSSGPTAASPRRRLSGRTASRPSCPSLPERG